MSGLEIVGFEYPFEDAPRAARKPDIRIGLRAGFMREAYVQFASGHRDSVFGRFVLQSVIGMIAAAVAPVPQASVSFSTPRS